MTQYYRRMISYNKNMLPDLAYNAIKSISKNIYLHNVGKGKIGIEVSSRQLRKIRSLDWVIGTKADPITASLYWPEN